MSDDDGDQLALQAAQETLLKCQTSIQLLEAQYKANQQIVEYNNAKTVECAAQDQRNLDDYNRKCGDRRKKNDEWHDCIRNRERAHLDWRGETGCVIWDRATKGWDCGDGKEGDGSYGGGCQHGWGKSRCKWSGESARKFAREDCGGEPPTDCGPRPGNVPCPLKQQDATQVAVNCCANVTSIVGSEVQQSTIQQQNACLNEKEKNLKQSQTQTSSSTTQPPTTTTTTNQQASNGDGGVTLSIIILVIVIICIIGFIYYNYYYKSSYYNPRLPYYPPQPRPAPIMLPPPPRPYYGPPPPPPVPRPAPIMLPPPPRPYYVPPPPPPPPAPVQFAPPPPVPVQMAPAPAPVSTQLPPGKYMTIGQGKVMKIG